MLTTNQPARISTNPDYKYVFVCGLARSGTSMLGRNIARLEDCTGFKNTGALQDEGQFLQDIYPVAADLGGAGRFGFDPRAHRTENSPLMTPENVARLHASWHAYWDKSKRICVEKTPGNLLMTRFLQAAFPNSYFIVVKRHPVPVSVSSQLLKNSFFKSYYLYITRKYEPRFAKWGYSLTNGMANGGELLRRGSKTYGIIGPLYCFGADVLFFCWRLGLRLKARAKQGIKALLPQFVLMRIRQAREEASHDQKQAGARSRHA